MSRAVANESASSSSQARGGRGEATRRVTAPAPATSTSSSTQAQAQAVTPRRNSNQRLLRSRQLSERAFTPTNVQSSEEQEFAALGDSMATLDVRFLVDSVAPPELTRPEPVQAPVAWGGSGGVKMTLPDGSSTTTPQRRRSRRSSLTSIMNEQKEEHQQRIMTSERVYIEKMEELRIADEAQEEALVQLALERSLRSLNDNKSVHSHRSSTTGNMMNRSFSSEQREAEYIREFQMEADRTEQVIFDSPHNKNSNSPPRRSSYRQQPSRDMRSLSRSSSGVSMRSVGSLSPTASGHVTNATTATQGRSPAQHRSRSLSHSPHPQPHTPLRSYVRSHSTSPGMNRPVVLRRTLRRLSSSDNNSSFTNITTTPTRATRSLSLNASPQLQAQWAQQQQQSPSAARSRSMGPRQQSIRLGPLPGNMLVGEDGLIVHDDASAEALLEMARQNLSPNEVTLLERALKKSIQMKQQQQQPQQQQKRASVDGGGGGGVGGSSGSGGRTRRTGPVSSSLRGDSRHSNASEASTASDDSLQDMSFRREFDDDVIQVAPKSPSVPAKSRYQNPPLLKEPPPLTPVAPTKSSVSSSPGVTYYSHDDEVEADLEFEDDDAILCAPKTPTAPSYRPFQNPRLLKEPACTTTATVSPVTSLSSPAEGVAYDLRGAEANLNEEELRQINQALLETGGEEESLAAAASAAAVESDPHSSMSEADVAAIARALHEAEEEEEMRNFRLALQMQHEEEERVVRQQQQTAAARRQPQGNVRTLTRAEVEAEARVGAFQAIGPPLANTSYYYGNNTTNHNEQTEVVPAAAGYRMNSNARQEWARRDQNSIVGPNNEVATKHDTTLAGQANAHRLGLEEDEYGSMPHVGNAAYNSFMQSVSRTQTKGVAAHGTGRAGSDAGATRGGAMDPNVRLLISRAVNSGYIGRCNGVVKEGKEAIVYHADKGDESGGFDVAIKVFKRIQDFKGRGDYVEGDPRFACENFRRISARDQLELWTEKEYRNLIRANRAGVPVPTPLFHKENTLFMRFLGTDGWPAPQLREVDIRCGSKKWEVLYVQVMDGIRKLYRKGRLVHGDLSEYNIIVAPACLVENASPGVENVDEDLQAVLIDFGQAVDIKHPDAVILLQRDLDRVKSFFSKQGVDTMGAEEALVFVVDDEE